MSTDKRRKNVNWTTCRDDGGISFDGAQLAVLMDIRDELQAIRRRLDCPRIPQALDAAVEAAAATKRIDKRLAKKVPLR